MQQSMKDTHHLTSAQFEQFEKKILTVVIMVTRNADEVMTAPMACSGEVSV
jgi:hypothetical protein